MASAQLLTLRQHIRLNKSGISHIQKFFSLNFLIKIKIARYKNINESSQKTNFQHML